MVRGLIALGGAVATAAGLHSVLSGVRSIPGADPGPAPDPVVDSELRFFGAIYAAFGLRALAAAAQGDPDRAEVRAVAATVFGAGVARLIGWRRAGRPSRGQLALLAVELTAPPVLLALEDSESRARLA